MAATAANSSMTLTANKTPTPRRSRESGFSMIELMITLAIIAILANMALVTFQDYMMRSKISSGLALASAAKLGVSEKFASSSTFPVSNPEAGLPSPTSIINNYVTSVEISDTPSPGSITITYNQFSKIDAGDTLLLIPAGSQGSLQWTCSSNNMESRYLPSVCR